MLEEAPAGGALILRKQGVTMDSENLFVIEVRGQFQAGTVRKSEGAAMAAALEADGVIDAVFVPSFARAFDAWLDLTSRTEARVWRTNQNLERLNVVDLQ